MASTTSLISSRSATDRAPMTAPPVVEGPRWYRSRIRVLGPFAALIPPAIIGTIAVLSLRVFEGPWSGGVGLIGGVLAAPALLAVGAPFGDSQLYPLAIAASVVLWLLVGVLASRRATRSPMADWADFWRHYAWMCGGIWAGCIAALVIASRTVGKSLF